MTGHTTATKTFIVLTIGVIFVSPFAAVSRGGEAPRAGVKPNLVA